MRKDLTKNLFICTLLMGALCQTGCRQGIKANGGSFDKGRLQKLKAAESAVETKVQPVDIADGFAQERVYFQSRTPIVIAIKPDVAGPGDVFSLFNDSTSKALVSAQSVALTDTSTRPGFAIVEPHETYALAPYSLMLTLYPLDPAYAEALGYGDNRLRLLVEDTAGQRQATTVIKRGDFTFIGRGSGTFESQRQRADGLEVRFGEVTKAALTNGENNLTVGRVSSWSR